ncbi:MAG: BACON domain-containing carbohydrate-binding protein [Bryobacteraceae bacterium]|jgi:hypothetical protein
MPFSRPKYIPAYLLLGTVVWGIGTATGQVPAGSNCHVDFPSPQAAVPYAGAVTQLNFQVDQLNCVASPESKVDWVSVSVVPPGSNAPPTVQYAVQPNLSFHSRTTSISVGGQVLTISQEAGPQPGIAGPSSLEWVVHEKSNKQESKILHVGSDDPDLDVTAVPSAQAVGWLSVQKSGDDGRSFEISIHVRDLKAGMYAGQIVVHAAGARNDPLSIPVNVKILPAM